MTTKLVSVRFSPPLDPAAEERLFLLLAAALDRYLRANVDFAADSRVYVAMTHDGPEAPRC